MSRDRGILRRNKKFRKLIRKFQTDALEELSKLIMLQAGRKLGMMGRGNTLIFDSETEADILADFAIWELSQGGTTAIERHLKKISGSEESDDVERELVDGMQKAFTSLFEIEDILEDRILIRDILSDESRAYILVDTGLLQTGVEGVLLFTRLVPLTDFCISCGTSFPFRGESKSFLIAKYKNEISRVKRRNPKIKRYTMFYRQWKKIGIPVEYR